MTTSSSLALAMALGAISAGVASALLVTTFGSSSSQAPLVQGGGAQPVDTIDAEVKELRAENQALRARLEALENRPAPTLRIPAATVSQEDFAAFAAFEAEVREWMASTKGPRLAASEIEADVENVLTSIRQRERDEAYALKLQRRDQQMEGRLERLSTKLGLSSPQVGEMRTLFTTHAERNDELARLWREGSDEAALGEMKRTIYRDYESELERILSPEQLETYSDERGGK